MKAINSELSPRLSTAHIAGSDERRWPREESGSPKAIAEELREFYLAEDRKRHRRRLLFHGLILLVISVVIAWGIFRAF